MKYWKGFQRRPTSGRKTLSQDRAPRLCSLVFHAVAAARLGLVKRRVRSLHQFLEIITGALRTRDADADRHTDRNARIHETKLRDRIANALGDSGCFRRRCVRPTAGQFFAADATEEIAFPQHAGKRKRRGLENIVADVVAKGVIDRLEVIEIEEKHRRGNVAIAAACKQSVRTLENGAAVRGAGKFVGLRRGLLVQLVPLFLHADLQEAHPDQLYYRLESEKGGERLRHKARLLERRP